MVESRACLPRIGRVMLHACRRSARGRLVPISELTRSRSPARPTDSSDGLDRPAALCVLRFLASSLLRRATAARSLLDSFVRSSRLSDRRLRSLEPVLNARLRRQRTCCGHVESRCTVAMRLGQLRSSHVVRSRSAEIMRDKQPGRWRRQGACFVDRVCSCLVGRTQPARLRSPSKYKLTPF